MSTEILVILIMTLIVILIHAYTHMQMDHVYGIFLRLKKKSGERSVNICLIMHFRLEGSNKHVLLVGMVMKMFAPKHQQPSHDPLLLPIAENCHRADFGNVVRKHRRSYKIEMSFEYMYV